MQTLQIRLTKELVKKAQDLVDKGIYSNKSEVIRDSLRRLAFKEELMTKDKTFKIIFTSDIHGNLTQYKKLFEKAYNERTEAIIIGGDIAPKDEKNRTIKGQKEFIENKLIPIIKDFHEKNQQNNHLCKVFIMMGNDDFRSNNSLFKKYEKTNLLKNIHNKVISLHENLKIAGYSYVPLTPFKYKDWERLDLTNKSEKEYRKGFLTEGTISKNNKFINVKFDLNDRKKTIEEDLNKLIKSPKETILVIHSPPYNTKLDITNSGEHVGSLAVRKFIEEKQPILTLHGHIHETVKMSGTFIEKINKTLCVSSGNDNLTNSLAIINLNLYDLNSIKRELI
ncbi:MAG: metallophosphoesterase [Candidatus Nanoarchaeia archaeon]|nr:metallophosphoesterase [Candidatus Nanoarchaeia archaeon]